MGTLSGILYRTAPGYDELVILARDTCCVFKSTDGGNFNRRMPCPNETHMTCVSIVMIVLSTNSCEKVISDSS